MRFSKLSMLVVLGALLFSLPAFADSWTISPSPAMAATRL